MFCTDIAIPLYYFFSTDASPLLYYSHLPTSIGALLLSLFLFSQSRKMLETKILLAMSFFFFLWSITDIALWVNIDGRIILLLWSFVNVFECVTSALALYFSYVFLEKRDAPSRLKLVVASILLPLVVLMPTHLNLAGFDIINCEPVQGILIYYFYFVELVLFLWLAGYLLKKYVTASPKERKKTAVFSLAILFFSLFFAGTNIIGSLTQAWEILMYGFFGVPVFLSLLAWLVVKYEAFNVKLIGTQALIMGLLFLVASQFFFIQDFYGLILNLSTLVIVALVGYVLIKEVKREVRRKEELQEISNRLAVANAELHRLDTAKSEFISIASHQLRTPLTAIKGFVSLLLEGAYGRLEPSVSDTLNKVYLANARLMNLVENLLNISRIEAGRIQYQFAPTKVEDILTELRDLFLLATHEKGLDLKFIVPKNLPVLSLDMAKIREVISNVIDNAIKYTEKGAITVTAEVVESKVVITVADTGVGIDLDDLPHIFKKFERGKNAAQVNVSSTGLGLYVGRSFIEAHGGTIRAESGGKGKGARFILELPLKREALEKKV